MEYDDDEKKSFVSQSNSALIARAPEPLSLKTKVAYGVGTVGNAATQVVGFFWNAFLLEVALLDPKYAGTVQLIAKVWDAVTDPIVGYLSDKTRTRWGRRRPWLLFSAIPVAVSFFMIWLTMGIESQNLKFAYFMLTYCFQRTMYTCYFVPYTSLTMELSSTDHERNLLTQFRFAIGAIGNIGFILVMGQITKNYSESLGEKYAYGLAALILSCLSVICIWACFLGVKEKDYELLVKKEKNNLGVFRGLLYVFKNKEYLILSVIACSGWLSLQLIQTNFILYFGYVLQLRDKFTLGLGLSLLLVVPGTPITRIIAEKLGKKRTWIIGCFFVISFGFASYFAVAKSIPYMLFICFLFGVSISFLYYLPWTMVPDTIDLDELKTGFRREGVYYSLFIFFEKVSAGLGLSLSNYILSLRGYDPQNPAQNRLIVAETLRYIISVGPAILVAISLVALYFYPITRTRLDEIQSSLRNKRQAAKEENHGIIANDYD